MACKCYHKYCCLSYPLSEKWKKLKRLDEVRMGRGRSYDEKKQAKKIIKGKGKHTLKSKKN